MSLLVAAVILIGFQEPVDFSKVDRRIAKEPTYLAGPLYGLIIFDPQGKSRVWFVLDRSSPKEPDHDILYIDRNGNGDLTETGERFAGVRGRGNWITHQPGPIKIGDTGPEHTDLTLFSSSAQMGGSGPHFRIKVGGKIEMWGGFARPGENALLGASPEKAPVFLASIEAPLTFTLALLKSEFNQGGLEKISVIVGVAGSGPASFVGVREDYLAAGKDRLFGTWIGKDFEGRPIRERFEIKSHCWTYIYDEDSVRVPKLVGPAKLRIEMESSTGKKSVPAEYPITLK